MRRNAAVALVVTIPPTPACLHDRRGEIRVSKFCLVEELNQQGL